MSEIKNRVVEIKPIAIGKIIDLYRKGSFAIPEFQRDYVWKASKAPILLDSLWNHFPIGAILTWSTVEAVHSRVRSRVHSPTQWIIDGQQRTRTLVKIMDGEILMLFDVKDQRFLLENAATKKEQSKYQFQVSEIWGSGYNEIIRNLKDISKSDSELKKFEYHLETCKDLLKREVPQIHLQGHELQEAILAFQRINTHGVRLKSTDIEIAELTIRHSGFVKNCVQPFLESLQEKGWDRIYVSQLFLACEGIAECGRRGDQRKRLHDLHKTDLNRAWIDLTTGVNEAISFLKDELGINSGKIFPSGAMLMPLAILLSRKNNNRLKVKGIINWMIAASLTKRYSGSSTEKLDRDIASCFASDPLRSLNLNIKKDSGRSTIKPNPNNFSGALHDRYGMFLTYLACRSSGMKDLFDGRQISSSSAEWHHIIPRSSVPKENRRELDKPSNISFISRPTNRTISNSKACDYLKNISHSYLKSQSIPLAAEIWKDPENFMNERAKMLSLELISYMK